MNCSNNVQNRIVRELVSIFEETDQKSFQPLAQEHATKIALRERDTPIKKN